MKKKKEEQSEDTRPLSEKKEAVVESAAAPEKAVAEPPKKSGAEAKDTKSAAPEDVANDLEKNLESIYTDREGNLPDFTRLDGKPTSRVKSFFIGLFLFLVVLAGVTWAGLWYFGRSGGGFTGDGVALTFETEDSLTAGETTEVTVRYRNGEAVPLASSLLTLKLPAEFVLLEANPAADENGEWPLGSISPGTDGTVTLKGWVRGSPEAALTFRGALQYKPADFSSNFERVGSHTVVVDDTALSVTATGPEQLTPGDEVEFTYTYSSTSTIPLDDVKFRLNPPEGFVVSGSEPASDEEGGLEWSLPTLIAGTDGTITVRGTFSSDARGPKRVDGSLGFEEDGSFIPLAQGSVETEVLKSALAMNMIVNGSNASTTATFGELLNFSITYANEGDVDLSDVKITANLPSRPDAILDWVALEDEHEGERKGTSVTWTSEEIEALEKLEPGDEGTIDFSVPLIKSPIADSPERRYGIEASITAEIGRVGTVARDREVMSSVLAIDLNSDTVFKAFGRYFNEDGIPLGAGPLPPKVGEPTVYRVFWVIENSLHELTNLSVETVLPQGAKWAGTERLVDAGELGFDESGRKATWRLNRMPTTVDRITVMFDVEYVPGFEDVGRIVEITDDIRFEALDKETESVILITERPVDTSLPADDLASGKGVVQE